MFNLIDFKHVRTNYSTVYGKNNNIFKMLKYNLILNRIGGIKFFLYRIFINKILLIIMYTPKYIKKYITKQNKLLHAKRCILLFMSFSDIFIKPSGLDITSF